MMNLFRLLALIPLSIALLAPAPAVAQDDDVDMEESEEESDDMMLDAWEDHRIGRGDMESLARLLSMTPEQKSSAMDLFAAYDTAMKSAYQKLADVQKSLQGEDPEDYDPETWNKLAPVYEKYNAHVEKLRDTFVEDLQLTLTDDQKALWPKFERRVRRKETMQGLMASGARADLIALTEQSMRGETWSPELSQLLDQYEVELDAALAEAAKWQEERMEEWRDRAKEFKSMTAEERVEASRRMMQEGVRRSKAVREINLKYVKRISDLLPVTKRFAFEDRYYSTSFWALANYGAMGRGAMGRKALDVIAGAKDIGITPEQQAKIDEIRADYETRRRADRDKHVATILDAEDNPKEGEQGGMFSGYSMDPQEMAQMWEKSREFEKETVGKLRAVFTAEQLAKLPPPLKEREAPDLDVDFDE